VILKFDTVPAIVFAFGVVTIGTAFVTSFTGLMICRAFLGLSEGGIQPGIAFALSCFYRRSELMLRVGLFIASASLAGAFGGLLAAALV
jgi:MFS family permease